MLNTGGGGAPLQIDHLVAWFIFRANEVGIERAKSDIDRFLNSPSVDLESVLWLHGVWAKEKIQLLDGVEFVPISKMPPSQEKYDFQYASNAYRTYDIAPPEAALTKTITVPKLFHSGSERSTEVDAHSQLQDMSVLINAIPGACCVPGYSTTYRCSDTPTGHLGSSGGSASVFDIMPRGKSELKAEYSDLLSRLFTKFVQIRSREKTRLAYALNRLAQAKGRVDHQDACLDLGISLEMLLLNTEHEDQELPGQLSLHFRLRGSWLIGDNAAERRALYRDLGKIYTLRSKIAHNGLSRELSTMRFEDRKKMLNHHFSICERIIQRLIMEGTPTDWASLVLGGLEPTKD